MEPQAAEMTFWEKIEMAQALMLYPAMTIIPLMRRRVGLRMLKGIYLWPPILVMGAVGWYLTAYHALAYGAALVLLVAFWQRHCRWHELKAGQVWHTRSLGVSPFEFLPLAKLPPALANFLCVDNRLYRWVDPLCVVLVGMVIAQVSDHVFGYWLMFAGLSLRIFEEFRWQEALDKLLDQYDSLISAEEQNEVLQHLRRGEVKPDKQPPAAGETAPPSTGIADDLRGQIAQRRHEAEVREELRRREALAAAEALHRAQPGPQVVKETVIVATVEETVRESFVHTRDHREAVGLVIVPVPELRAAVEAPGGEGPEEAAAIASGSAPPVLAEDAAPALPSPPPELPAPPENEAEK